MKYRSVIGFGKIHRLETPGEKAAVPDIIMDHYAKGTSVYPHEMLDRVAVLKITVESLTGKQSGC